MTRTREYFERYRGTQASRPAATGKIRFVGVEGQDVYNITAPFVSAGRTVMAGRVEPRNSERSQARFFEEKAGVWHLIPQAPAFQLQDPFVTFVGRELIFGGVEIYETPGGLAWRTVFYRGRDIFNLAPFFAGPKGMKDIRLRELADGRIGVFTRPQGRIGGRGTIGYTETDTLEGLSIELIEKALLLEGMFHPLDWGGANEAFLLSSGDIGVLSHIACFNQDDPASDRHYYASAFVFSPNTRRFQDFRIIASRDRFGPGAAKRPDLVDVVFSSGLVFREGKVVLYAGVSDAEAHWLEIDDPFDGKVLLPELNPSDPPPGDRK